MAEFVSILFLGAVVGSLYALSGFGLVLTYRVSGIFNFAQGALGMFFAYVFYQLAQGGQMNLVFFRYSQTFRLPRFVALAVVLLVLAPALGWGLDLVLFRRLRAASAVVQIVATIGLLISLQGVAGVVWGSATTLTPRRIFPGDTYEVAGIRMSLDQIITILLALGLAAALLAFLRLSPLGIRMRAVVDRPEVSELMGVNSRRVSSLSWAIATSFAALAGILVAPFYGSLDTFTLIFLGIAATAAAVVGSLQSLPLTMAGGLAIGVAQFLAQRYATGDLGRQLRPSIPFVVLFLALLIPRRYPDAGGPTYRAAAPERRYTSRQLTVRMGVLAAVLLAPVVIGGGWQAKVLGSTWATHLSLVPPTAIIFLSLVILSGYAGQVSLCQASLAGFGAFVCAHLVADWSWPFLIAAPVAGLATIPLGALLASRGTRLPPLYLGLATLAFAALMDEAAFNSQSFSNGLIGVFFKRPEFLQGARAYYLFGLAVFAGLALMARNLRNGRTGGALYAMRDSPLALASLGTGIAPLKFKVFCLSAFVAGLGGAMLSAGSQQASSFQYFRLQSLLFLALAVIGGIGSWAGALMGATMFQLLSVVLGRPWVLDSFVGKEIFNGQLEQLLPVFFGLGAIGLATNPNGVIEQTRDSWAKFRARLAGETVVAPASLADAAAVEVDGKAVTFPRASYYHRPGCLLATGKEGKPVTAARARKLSPCPVCEPDPVVARARPARAARSR